MKMSHELLEMLNKVSTLYAEYFHVHYDECGEAGFTYIDPFIDAMNKRVKRDAQDRLYELQEVEEG